MDAAGSSPAISKMYFVRQIHKYDQFGEIAQIAYITRGLFGGIIFCREKKRGRVWKGINWMAHYTEKAIISSFQEMLEEMPFDKITVTALTKRSDISPNTFYYHYQDIYALLDYWLGLRLDSFFQYKPWQEGAVILMRTIMEHRDIFLHIVDSLSRERLESYVFDSTLEGLTGFVTDEAREYNVTESQIREIVDFCRYLFVGVFIRFLRDRRNVSVEEVDTEVRHLTDLVEVFVRQSLVHYHETNDE